MNQFLNQFTKDFKQTLISPVFFLMAGFSSAIWGFIFPRKIFEFARYAGAPSFSGQGGYNIYETVFINHISTTHLLLLLIAPAVTMRLLAEEKKLKTFDLLLSSPITSTQIVLSKFFAGWLSVLILVLLSLSFPLITSFFIDFNMNLLFSAYGSVALLMAVYTALGLFSSALTSSILLSVFLGAAFNVALHFVGLGGQFSDNPLYSAVMEYVSVSTHLSHFFRGNVNTSSLLFFIITAGFFIFLSQKMVESSRWRSS